jgi:hypothetical protein
MFLAQIWDSAPDLIPAYFGRGWRDLSAQALASDKATAYPQDHAAHWVRSASMA